MYPLTLKTLLGAAFLAAVASSASALPFPLSGPTVPGNKALLRSGQAAAPEDAPLVVKRAIWAANQLRSKPYRYGGGHASFVDNAYDCSGTVSYSLGGAGLIKSPMSSSDFRRFGDRGHGKCRMLPGVNAGNQPGSSLRACRRVSMRGIRSDCNPGALWHSRSE